MRQKLKIALQMDPLEKRDLRGDSTFILGLEAIKRGFEVYFYSPTDLIYKNNNVYAKTMILNLAFENGKERFNYGKVKVLKLSALDVILKPNGYSYFTQENIIIVKDAKSQIKRELETLILKLKYINSADLSAPLQTVLSEQGSVQAFTPLVTSTSGGNVSNVVIISKNII